MTRTDVLASFPTWVSLKTSVSLKGGGASLAMAALLLFAAAPLAQAQQSSQHQVRSPDGRLVVTVQAGGDRLTYAVAYEGQTLVQPSPISMTTRAKGTLGVDPTVTGASRRSVDRVLRPVVPVKSARVPDRFNELTLDFTGGFSVAVRAYDSGVAYRFETGFSDSLTVERETATFDLASAAAFGADSVSVFWARSSGGARGESDFITHSESYYQPTLPFDSLAGRMSTVPLFARYGAEGPRVVVTEASLEDYAGMFVRGKGGGGTLRGAFPKAALAEATQGEDERNTFPTRRADYLARTTGERAFPWRAVIAEESDAALLENQLVYKLAPELRLSDPDWIDPGKVAWDWYNALNLYGVDFEAGVNTRTYKHYVDFAAEYGLDYIVLDEGWYKLGDLTNVSNEIDMDELADYANEKDVGLILWMVWKTLDRQMQVALDQFDDWGISGIKVDFMQRDDRGVVDFYWRTAREAAERELLVDFHGNYKPTGLRRAYPNVITREGVNGLEQNKWSDRLTAQHNVTIPFTRMVAGPIDYTPGAMVNAQPDNFAARFERPMSQTTRAQQLAMYVVYESPLQMLADSPSQYRRAAPTAMDFLTAVPTVWDETRALKAQVGAYVVVARRRGPAWYLGAMADGEARTMSVDLSFLEEGPRYRMTTWTDGPNAARYAEDTRKRTRAVSAGETVTIEMASAGGFVARIREAEAGSPDATSEASRDVSH